MCAIEGAWSKERLEKLLEACVCTYRGRRREPKVRTADYKQVSRILGKSISSASAYMATDLNGAVAWHRRKTRLVRKLHFTRRRLNIDKWVYRHGDCRRTPDTDRIYLLSNRILISSLFTKKVRWTWCLAFCEWFISSRVCGIFINPLVTSGRPSEIALRDQGNSRCFSSSRRRYSLDYGGNEETAPFYVWSLTS